MYCNACERTVAKAISKCKGILFFKTHNFFVLFFWFMVLYLFVCLLILYFVRGGEIYNRHEETQGCGDGSD